MTDEDPILLEPFRYLCSQPGKEIRSHLIEAFQHWINVPSHLLDPIKSCVEMLHNASLLYVSCFQSFFPVYVFDLIKIDDVQDESTLRRGRPVAHKIYGVAQTINCANYVYFRALAELQKLNKPEAVTIFTEEMQNLHRGQGMDIFWRDTRTCPSEDEYLTMIRNKTGGLLRLAVKIMQVCSSCTENYVDLVDQIGVLYQIRDDYINLQSEDYMKNKTFCEDLTEGKFSYPILYAIRSDTSNRQLLSILSQRPSDLETKLYAVSIMEQAGAFQYARETLKKVEEGIRNEIRRLGGNPKLEAIIDALKI